MLQKNRVRARADQREPRPPTIRPPAPKYPTAQAQCGEQHIFHCVLHRIGTGKFPRTQRPPLPPPHTRNTRDCRLCHRHTHAHTHTAASEAAEHRHTAIFRTLARFTLLTPPPPPQPPPARTFASVVGCRFAGLFVPCLRDRAYVCVRLFVAALSIVVCVSFTYARDCAAAAAE